MTSELLESYVALREMTGIAIAKANVLAICHHGSPVRLDVIQTSAITMLSDVLSELTIPHTIDGLRAACDRRQTGIAIWREFRDNSIVEKIGPAIYHVPRSQIMFAKDELETAVLEISERLDLYKKFNDF